MKSIVLLALAAVLTSCGKQEPAVSAPEYRAPEEPAHDHTGHDHDHGEETPLGKFTAGDMEIEASQSHGDIEPGKEGHLVIKLPYNDAGATVVRAWIGREDRTLSSVGRGEYAAAHDDYDIHTMAPDPLPEGVMWWVEIEKPDGTKVVGSIKPKM